MEIRKGIVYINGKTIGRATISELLSLTAEDIGKLTKKQSIQLEKRLYRVAKQRLGVIYKHGLSPPLCFSEERDFASPYAIRTYRG